MKLAAIALALAGCGSSPSCEDAFGKANATLHWSDKQLASAIKTCNQLGYKGEVRTCIAAASTGHDLPECLKKDPGLVIELAQQRAREAESEARAAEQQAKDAVDAAKNAQDEAAQVSRELIELGKKVDAATDALAAAQNDADRQAARAKLDALREQRAALEPRIQALKAAARANGTSQGSGCVDNPNGPGVICN